MPKSPDFVVIRVSLSSAGAPDSYSAGMHTLASVSLHALARRFQRGSIVTDVAVTSDLRALAEACGRLVAQKGPFELSCANGRWIGRVAYGEVRNGGRSRVVIVRTFLD